MGRWHQQWAQHCECSSLSLWASCLSFCEDDAEPGGEGVVLSGHELVIAVVAAIVRVGQRIVEQIE